MPLEPLRLRDLIEALLRYKEQYGDDDRLVVRINNPPTFIKCSGVRVSRVNASGVAVVCAEFD